VCAVLRPGDYEPYQRMPLALAEHGLAIGAGVALLSLALRSCGGGRPPVREAARTADA
ncbi:hypothetical protein G3I40_32665, partial [Streptomyces sp. SID14478]|nr:hypothetical protein [Streptomyces sp. SID14478]